MRGPSEENDHYLTVRFLPEYSSYEILHRLWRLLIRSSGRRCFDVECHFYTFTLQIQGSNVPGPKRSANTVSLVKIVTHCIGIGPTDEAKCGFLSWAIATWKGISSWLKECGKIINLDVSWYPLFVRDSFEKFLTQKFPFCWRSEICYN